MRIGWTNIPVLEFLVNQPWDDVARGYVHALRPSSIRVTDGIRTSDAKSWRVTVLVEGDIIKRIEQEVEVDLGERFEHGHALDCELARRMGRIA